MCISVFLEKDCKFAFGLIGQVSDLLNSGSASQSLLVNSSLSKSDNDPSGDHFKHVRPEQVSSGLIDEEGGIILLLFRCLHIRAVAGQLDTPIWGGVMLLRSATKLKRQVDS